MADRFIRALAIKIGDMIRDEERILAISIFCMRGAYGLGKGALASHIF